LADDIAQGEAFDTADKAVQARTVTKSGPEGRGGSFTVDATGEFLQTTFLEETPFELDSYVFACPTPVAFRF